MPSLSEVIYCIKFGKVKKHELIIYKLLIDFYLELHLLKRDYKLVINSILPMCIKFYNQVGDKELR